MPEKHALISKSPGCNKNGISCSHFYYHLQIVASSNQMCNRGTHSNLSLVREEKRESEELNSARVSISELTIIIIICFM